MIKFNEVTRFSKLIAVILFIIIWLTGVYVGIQFEHDMTADISIPAPEDVKKVMVLDPTIRQVITSNDMSNYNELTNSLYRLIIKNTEYDPCLYLDEVYLNVESGPELVRTQKLCRVNIDGVSTSLTEGVAHVGYENIVWKNGKITFDLDLGGSELLVCHIDDVEQAVVMGDLEGVSTECSFKTL